MTDKKMLEEKDVEKALALKKDTTKD